MTAPGGSPGRERRLALAAALALSLPIGFGVVAVRVWPGGLAGLAASAMHLERRLGAASAFAAFLVQLVIALCGVLPASIGALAAGMLYGAEAGFAIAASAILCGAVIAFLLSRSLFRPLIVRLVGRHPRAGSLDRAVADQGWRLVCLLRISPIMPFAVTSYALGLTSLRLGPYLAGTLAALPALLGYVVLGSLADQGIATIATFGSGTSGAGLLHAALLGLGVVGTVLLTLMSVRIARLATRPLPDRPVA